MQTGSYLAVVPAPERAAVLPLHADGVLALLREPGVVDDEGLDPRHLPIELASEPRSHLVVGPGALGDASVKPLPHRRDLALVVDEPSGHRLDALPLSVEQQAGDVPAHRAPSLRPAHPLDKRLYVSA